MKKLLGILVLGLLWCNTSFAECIDDDCEKKSEIETYKVYRNNLTGLYLGQFLIQRKRKKYEYLKKHQDETIDIFKYKYPLGAFAGSQKFIFRLNFIISK